MYQKWILLQMHMHMKVKRATGAFTVPKLKDNSHKSTGPEAFSIVLEKA